MYVHLLSLFCSPAVKDKICSSNKNISIRPHSTELSGLCQNLKHCFSIFLFYPHLLHIMYSSRYRQPFPQCVSSRGSMDGNVSWSVHHFGLDWNILTIGQIARYFGTYLHCSQRTNPNEFGDPLIYILTLLLVCSQVKILIRPILLTKYLQN